MVSDAITLSAILDRTTTDATASLLVEQPADYAGVVVVSINRPQVRNALDLDSWLSLVPAVQACSNARVVLLTGTGADAFSAGADISEFPEQRMSARDALRYNRAIADALEAVRLCPAPVVAVLRGLAVGGGCELAAACDIRLASTDTRLGIPIGRLGVTLGLVEARTVASLIGSSRLKELIFSGRLIDADEAMAIGLVDRVVAVDELTRSVSALVGSVTRASQHTIRATKHILGLVGREVTPADVDIMTASLLDVYGGADLAEGVAAFLGRRPPEFGPRTTEQAEATVHLGGSFS